VRVKKAGESTDKQFLEPIKKGKNRAAADVAQIFCPSILGYNMKNPTRSAGESRQLDRLKRIENKYKSSLNRELGLKIPTKKR
jgi:hypothetical protein